MRKFLLPPVLPAIFTIIGAVVHFTVWSFALFGTPWNFVSGGVIVAISVLITWASITAFRHQGESLDVGDPTEKLVSDGIYATSRNPVYLAFLIFIAGVGCIVNSLAILLAVIPAFAVLNWYTIPREERYLRRTLGDDYESYVERVRRWL